MRSPNTAGPTTRRATPRRLSRNGTPWNGPRGNAGSAAMARPMSGSGTTTALSTGWRRRCGRSRSPRARPGDLAVGDQIAQRNRVKPPQIVGGHGRSLCDLSTNTSSNRATFSGGYSLVLRCDVQRPRSPSIPWRGTTVCSTGLVAVMPTVKPFTSRPLRCRTVSAPESGSSAGTPSRRRA